MRKAGEVLSDALRVYDTAVKQHEISEQEIARMLVSIRQAAVKDNNARD